jgi:hypothetical protein
VAKVSLSMDTFNFTTENCCTNAQPLLITSRELLLPLYS